MNGCTDGWNKAQSLIHKGYEVHSVGCERVGVGGMGGKHYTEWEPTRTRSSRLPGLNPDHSSCEGTVLTTGPPYCLPKHLIFSLMFKALVRWSGGHNYV